MSDHVVSFGRDADIPIVQMASRRLAILAMSGAGKSNAAAVMAEHFYDAHVPFVVVDPKGDWYGLRSDKTGKGPGLPVPIFGGIHGDVKLEPTGGAVMAELIAEERLSCVLDVSEFTTRQEMFRFLADFANTLLRKNRDPLMVFAEEADEYLPQKAGEKGYGPICLGAWQRLVKRGRFRGIGTTQISQRTASLNKDVLNMAEALIVMRTTAPHDRKAIKAWVTEHASDKSDLVESLPSLEDGEAWIWSPQWLKIMKRAKFPLRRTFDSGKTPELGIKRRTTTLAEIDLGVISKKMADTIERAKQDDPKELRKQLAERDREITRLELELQSKQVAKPTLIEVPVLTPACREALHEACLNVGFGIEDAHNRLTRDLDLFMKPYTDAVATAQRVLKEASEAFVRGTRDPQVSHAPAGHENVTSRARRNPEPERDDHLDDAGRYLTQQANGTGEIVKGKSIAELLCQRHPLVLTWGQIATMTGVVARGGAWNDKVRELRRGGWVVEDSAGVRAADKTFAAVGIPKGSGRSPTTGDLYAMWGRVLPTTAWELFDIIRQHPASIPLSECAQRLGVADRGGAWNDRVRLLKRNNLIVVDGGRAKPNPEVFG